MTSTVSATLVQLSMDKCCAELSYSVSSICWILRHHICVILGLERVLTQTPG